MPHFTLLPINHTKKSSKIVRIACAIQKLLWEINLSMFDKNHEFIYVRKKNSRTHGTSRSYSNYLVLFLLSVNLLLVNFSFLKKKIIECLFIFLNIIKQFENKNQNFNLGATIFLNYQLINWMGISESNERFWWNEGLWLIECQTEYIDDFNLCIKFHEASINIIFLLCY